MIPNPITDAVLALPERDRLDLARRIVESIAAEHQVAETVSDGVRRIEEVVTGKVSGLSVEAYRRGTQ